MNVAINLRNALPGLLILLWAVAAWAAPGGTAGNLAPAAATAPTSAVLPSVEILNQQTNLAGTCGGQAFNLNTYINVDTQASAGVLLSAPGFPVLEQFTDETGSNIGPFSGVYPTFNIKAFGGGSGAEYADSHHHQYLFRTCACRQRDLHELDSIRLHHRHNPESGGSGTRRSVADSHAGGPWVGGHSAAYSR